MSTGHETESLGAYVLGALDQREIGAVEQHLATCPTCRHELSELTRMRTALDDLPPEAMLDGPPEDGDLLLQRTLRRVRNDRNRGVRLRRVATGAAAVVVAIAFAGGGMVVGRGTAPQPVAQPPVVSAPPTGTLPAGTRTGEVNQGSVHLATAVKPAAGWVRVSITVVGIPAGEKCRMIVVAKDGTRQEAGSWLVSRKGEKEPTTLDGSALIAPNQVAAVEVENFAGKKFVSVPI